MEYFDAMLDLVSEINRSKTVTVVADRSGYDDPLTDAEREAVIRESGLSLAEPVQEFYRQSGGAMGYWKEQGCPHAGAELWERCVCGRFRILQLREMLLGERHAPRWKDVLWLEDMPEAEREPRMRLRPFDFFDREGGRAICLTVDGGVLTDRLAYVDLNGGIHAMGMGIEEYVGVLLRTRGYWGWREVHAGDTRRLAAMKVDVPRLFGSTDLSAFDHLGARP